MSDIIRSSSSKGWPYECFDTQILRAEPSLIRFEEASSSRPQLPSIVPASESDRSDLFASTQRSLNIAATELRNGNVVAFPTETVYGLGADATNALAVSKIYRAKGRPSDNPLIVHISDTSMLDELVEKSDVSPKESNISAAYQCLIDAFWPGSLTLLFPVRRLHPSSKDKGKQRAVLPDIVTSGLQTVGLRMPSHPLARSLIAQVGRPIAAPSSNASGRPSPTTAQHVFYDLGGPLDADLIKGERSETNGGINGNALQTPRGRIRYILDGGPCYVGLESTVIDGITDPGEIRILRPGGVTVEEISFALASRNLLVDENGENHADSTGKVRVRVYGKDMERSAAQEANPTTPGMKYKHYSPNARVVLVDVGSSSARANGAVCTLKDMLQAELGPLAETAGAEAAHIGFMAPAGSNLAQAVASLASRSASESEGASRVKKFSMHLDGNHARTAALFLYDLGAPESPGEGAQRLFAGLRVLDEAPQKCQVIFVETMKADRIGLAIMNRLEKAASERISIDL
ncbi:translation factor [Tilletiaria anomala UBC 951]|uniref:Threonylcarbamoyl-AMP synthase n=1 Tax=Tilletiaria anomala (strain ATCC 24038 / CBS 436.72 / UBC 951) TaxID=1037660 RepID=A0A066W5U9_TILAU|nr:translation factor [Tilletiaria anomala UBC 951]KDN46444.1 translation factor [Tilletiaria anomala UBC 951]